MVSCRGVTSRVHVLKLSIWSTLVVVSRLSPSTTICLQVEEEDDFHALVNPTTQMETAAVGDVNMSSLKKGDIIQLERKGYFIVDVPYGGSADKPAVLFSIPDGRTK